MYFTTGDTPPDKMSNVPDAEQIITFDFVDRLFLFAVLDFALRHVRHYGVDLQFRASSTAKTKFGNLLDVPS
jgi:hypothetical protein